MSASLTIQYEVQPDNVGFPADDLGLPSAVEGEGYTTALKHPARIAPHYREGAEALPSGRNVNPRRATQLMPVRQADGGAACDVAIHASVPFLKPACCHHRPFGSTPVKTPGGGNLARALFTRAGLSSFCERPKHLGAYFTNPTESAGVLPAADRASAAMDRLPPAESRSFPFNKINHVCHAVLPSDLEGRRAAFANLQKVFAA